MVRFLGIKRCCETKYVPVPGSLHGESDLRNAQAFIIATKRPLRMVDALPVCIHTWYRVCSTILGSWDFTVFADCPAQACFFTTTRPVRMLKMLYGI